MPGEFRAVYVSHKRVYVGSRLRRTRELFALDCTFTFLNGSRSFTVRIHKDNPVARDLQLKTVYRFEEVGSIGFKAMRDVVTDLKTESLYHMAKA